MLQRSDWLNISRSTVNCKQAEKLFTTEQCSRYTTLISMIEHFNQYGLNHGGKIKNQDDWSYEALLYGALNDLCKEVDVF